MSEPAPASVAIILPVYNESGILLASLKALQVYRQAGISLIVVDGGSTDNSAKTAVDWVDSVVCCEKGRAKQMNFGASCANAQWLIFLHADTQLLIGPEQLLEELKITNASWGFFVLYLSGLKKIYKVISYCINLRSRISRVATGDQAIFIRRTIFVSQRGFAEIPLMEDIELSKRLRKISAPKIIESAITSSRRWEKKGVLRTVFLMWKLRLAFWGGVSARKLVRFYD